MLVFSSVNNTSNSSCVVPWLDEGDEFSCLGDMLDADAGCEIAVLVRVRCM